MKSLLKITLVAGIAVSAMNIPVSAEAGLFSGLRGMFSPQADVSEFEGNFVQAQGQAWQQAPVHTPAQFAQSSYNSTSSYVPSSVSTRTAEPGVKYYTAQEYYGLQGATPRTVQAPKRSGWGLGNGWGFGNVYDYESGSHCGKKCAPAPVVQRYVPRPTYAPVRQQYQQTYRQVTQYRCWDGEIVATQSGCKPQTTTVEVKQYRCWDGEVVTDVNGCKTQTVTREVTRTVDSTPSYSGSSSSYSSSSSSAWTGGGTPTNCPAGTSAQSDGTCLEISSSSSSFSSHDSGFSSSSSSYGSGSSFGGTIPTNCPSGTTAQSDGTCLEGGYSDFTSPFAGSSVELFPTQPSTTPSYGYSSDGSYGAVDYPPLRK